MKACLRLLFMMACFSLIITCSKQDDILDDSLALKCSPIVNNNTHGLEQERFVPMKDIDLNVHYRVIGKGPINMVFVPGWTNPLTVYTKQFDYFRHRARCIYIDLPGQGNSDAPQPGDALNPESTGVQYTMELMADAVYAVVKKEGLHHFVAVGFSMGPRVWGMFERSYPGMIYKLVAIDGGFNPWPTDPVAREAYISTLEATYLAQIEWDENIKTTVAASLIPPDLEGEDAEQLKEWGTYFASFPSDILANIYYYSEAENVNEPVGWQYPKLCFYSNPNPNMDKVNLIYPNNTVYTFPGGGHVIQWIFHEEINPLIWDFVKGRPGKKHWRKDYCIAKR